MESSYLSFGEASRYLRIEDFFAWLGENQTALRLLHSGNSPGIPLVATAQRLHLEFQAFFFDLREANQDAVPLVREYDFWRNYLFSELDPTEGWGHLPRVPTGHEAELAAIQSGLRAKYIERHATVGNWIQPDWMSESRARLMKGVPIVLIGDRSPRLALQETGRRTTGSLVPRVIDDLPPLEDLLQAFDSGRIAGICEAEQVRVIAKRTRNRIKEIAG